jgi:hypothetical protein
MRYSAPFLFYPPPPISSTHFYPPPTSLFHPSLPFLFPSLSPFSTLPLPPSPPFSTLSLPLSPLLSTLPLPLSLPLLYPPHISLSPPSLPSPYPSNYPSQPFPLPPSPALSTLPLPLSLPLLYPPLPSQYLSLAPFSLSSRILCVSLLLFPIYLTFCLVPLFSYLLSFSTLPLWPIPSTKGPWAWFPFSPSCTAFSSNLTIMERAEVPPLVLEVMSAP